MTETAHESDSNTVRMLNRTKAIAIFINQVGIPSIIILVFVGLITATWMGKIPSPVVTSTDFNNHIIRTEERHDAIIRNTDAQVEVLRETKTVLKSISCELKPTDRERVECFKEMNEQN